MGPNVKFPADRGLAGFFAEASSYAPGSDLAKLKSYLMAKQLWNPDRNATHTIAEFLVGYYGRTGGNAVKVYMDTMSHS